MKVTDIGAALDPQFERISDTPRTDHAFNDEYCYSEYVSKEFAQQLERELAEARKDAERYRKVYEHGFCKSHSRKALSNRLCAVCGFAKNDRIHINMDAAMKEGGK